MGVRPRKQAAPKKAAPKRKEAPRKAAPRKEQARPSEVYMLYRRTMDDLWQRMGSGLVTQIKAAVRTHDEVAVVAYWGWHVSKHPQVKARVRDELSRARYYDKLPSARSYVAYIMDHTSEIDLQYIKRFRDLLFAVFERLDYEQFRGTWKLLPVPTLDAIREKIHQLGGSDPDKAVPNIYRSWVAQKATTKRQQQMAEDEETARQTGQTPEEVREEGAKREASRKQDLFTRRFQQFSTDVSETGELVKECVADGMYLIRGGRRVKLNAEAVETIVNLWIAWKNRQKRERRAGDADQASTGPTPGADTGTRRSSS